MMDAYIDDKVWGRLRACPRARQLSWYQGTQARTTGYSLDLGYMLVVVLLVLVTMIEN